MRRLLIAVSIVAALFALAGPLHAGDIKPFARGSWSSILAAHAGEPLIVHLWGLTCGPCRSEMPAWGRLLAEKPDLPLVTIHTDLAQDELGAVESFLAKSGLLDAENWAFDDRFAERLRYEVDPKWQGEVPITFLISRSGAVRKIEGPADMAEITAWLANEKESLN